MLRIIHKHILESTQDYAWSLLPSFTNDVLVIADVQTKGRGSRRKRLWISDAGNFHGSFLVDVAKIGYSSSNVSALNTNVMFAVQQTIVHISSCCGINIKLPNDIYHKGKKMAGVLIEVVYPIAIIGIGINLVSSPIDRATSVKEAFGIEISNTDANLIDTLYKKITRFLN